jgi:hypothetical protein
MDEVVNRIFQEHLPYELDMLEAAFTFLHSPTFADRRNDVYEKNRAIEAFWTHARNLIEFLAHPRTDDHKGVVSARDFTTGQFDPGMKMREMDQRINAQVSHLTYERRSSPEQKLGGYEMLRVKQAIDRGIKLFEQALAPEYKEMWSTRIPSKWIEVDGTLCATNQTTTTGIIIVGGP